MKEYANAIKNFSNVLVGVVGDIMLDRYLIGEVDRISPEAPAPVFLLREEKKALGGAANVAANIKNLGARVVLAGRIGKDQGGKAVLRELKRLQIGVRGVMTGNDFPTTQKSRIVANGQQIVRIDEEDVRENKQSLEKRVFAALTKMVAEGNAIIISDYAKGFVTERIAKYILSLAKKRKIPVIVDTKPQHKHFFKGATLVAPNKKEAEEISGIRISDQKSLIRAGKKLQLVFSSHILITRGFEGMSLFCGKEILHLPSVAREVYEVTGAGDTSISAFTLGIASGMSWEDSARLATIAAGIVVGKQGTATASPEELSRAVKESKLI